MLLVQAGRIIFDTDETYLTAFRTRLCWFKNQSSIDTSTRCWRNSKYAAQTMRQSISPGGTITQHLISLGIWLSVSLSTVSRNRITTRGWHLSFLVSKICHSYRFVQSLERLACYWHYFLYRRIYRQRVENTEGCLSRKHVEGSTRGQAGQVL